METKEINKITDEMYKALSASFPPEAYSAHPTKTFLTTLKAYYISERLNEVFGVGRWEVITSVVKEWAQSERKNTAGSQEGYVLVRGRFVSYDYDVECTEQYGGHKTTGKNTEEADLL